MTKDKAIYNFFSGFGLSTHAAANVPKDTQLPYLTYELNLSAFEEGEVGITVQLWYYTESETLPNAKAQELSEAIGRGGKIIPCDSGAIWLKRGSPWCQSISDASDTNIKRRYINVTAEYLTQD